MYKERRKQKIHTTSFLKYFTLKIPSRELSDSHIVMILETWDKSNILLKDIQTVFYGLKKKGQLVEFLNKVNKLFLPDISSKVGNALIKFIYSNTNLFSQGGAGNLWGGSECDKAVILMMNLVNNVVRQSELQSTLEEITLNTSDIYLAVEVVLYCRKERQGNWYRIYENVNFNELKDKVAERLEKHFIYRGNDIFEELGSIDKWHFVLYQWATNWGVSIGDNKQIVTDYIKSIVNNNVQKFISFLRKSIEDDDLNKQFFNLGKFNKAYLAGEFIDIASNFKNSSQITPEGLRVIDMFLKAATSKKIKILYFEPLGTSFDQDILKKGWDVIRKEEKLRKLKDYDVVILFLHEEAGEGKKERLTIETQNGIINYVQNGGNVIAFHDVLFSRNKILSDNLCGHFKGPLGGKEVDIEVKAGEEHSINKNIANFKVKDEGWEGAIPKVESSERLVVLFINQNEEPVVWLREYNNGEVLVISLGHSKELIENKNVQGIVYNAIKYFTHKK